MELYWGSGSTYAWRVQLGLLIKGVEYEDHLLSFSAREHKQPAYTSLNPRGKVPTLVDGDTIITESLAILTYLDQTHPTPSLFGDTAAEHARIWRKVLEIDRYLQDRAAPVIRALFNQRVGRDLNGHRATVSELRTELDRVNAEAESGPLNAVDCLMVPLLATLERASMKAGAESIGLLPLDMERWGTLSERYTTMKDLDGFARTWPPHW